METNSIDWLFEIPDLTGQNKYNYVLNLFCSSEIERDNAFMKSFIIDDKVFSTNYYLMAWTAKDRVDNMELIKEYDPKKVLKNIPNPFKPTDISFSPEELKQVAYKMKTEEDFDIVGSDIECKTCDGEGVVTWHFENYENEGDCPVCDGSGLSYRKKKRPNGRMKLSNYNYVGIGNSYFDIVKILPLYHVAMILNVDKIKLIHQTQDNKASVFQIGDINILAMPVMADEFQRVETIKLK